MCENSTAMIKVLMQGRVNIVDIVKNCCQILLMWRNCSRDVVDIVDHLLKPL